MKSKKLTLKVKNKTKLTNAYSAKISENEFKCTKLVLPQINPLQSLANRNSRTEKHLSLKLNSLNFNDNTTERSSKESTNNNDLFYSTNLLKFNKKYIIKQRYLEHRRLKKYTLLNGLIYQNNN
jgi:hypothetical protein